MQRTMEFLTKNPKASLAEAREIAQTEGMRQASALNQQVTWLADIGTVAPMLGLLGTVFGIIQSFGVVAVEASATRPTMLAQGIGEALIATAAGLVVGIPAMMAYAFTAAEPRRRFPISKPPPPTSSPSLARTAAAGATSCELSLLIASRADCFPDRAVRGHSSLPARLLHHELEFLPQRGRAGRQGSSPPA